MSTVHIWSEYKDSFRFKESLRELQWLYNTVKKDEALQNVVAAKDVQVNRNRIKF